MQKFTFTLDTDKVVVDVDVGDSGSMDSGRPETPDTDESSEVSSSISQHFESLMCMYVY